MSASAAAWRAAGHALAARLLGVPLGGIDLVSRTVLLPDRWFERDTWGTLLACGPLARMVGGQGPGPSLPWDLPASAWVAAAHLLDEHASELRELARFIDEVLWLPGHSLDAYWETQ
jgi:hypothetical protein